MNKVSNIRNTLYSTTLYPLPFRGYKVQTFQSDTLETDSKKNEKDNLGIKLLLGGLALGGAVLVGIKLHNPQKVNNAFKSEFKNIEHIRKNLSEIFEKDLTAKEADELAKNYKRICQISSDEEYVTALFEQLKKDYGFKNSHIKLEIQDFKKCDAPSWAAQHTNLGHMVVVSRIGGKLDSREDLFDTLFHELKHHKQFEISIATDKHAFEDALACKKLKEYTQEQISSHGGEEKVKNWLKQEAQPYLQPEFDRIEQEIGQIAKDSPLYRRGLNYIEATKNYVQEAELLTRAGDYESSILESEAKKVGKLAREIFGNLT